MESFDDYYDNLMLKTLGLMKMDYIIWYFWGSGYFKILLQWHITPILYRFQPCWYAMWIACISDIEGK